MDAATPNERIETVFAGARVVPVLTIPEAATALPLARALVAGGLKVLEITIRTPVSMEALKTIAQGLPEAIVGAGTVLDAKTAHAAAEAGAKFLVSPGFSQPVIWAAADADLPCLPGVMTPGEVMRARELGLTRLKLFPANTAGGLSAVKALAAPFPEIRFCPTGGIRPDTAPEYLAHPSVFAIGGSWVAPGDAIKDGAWEKITELAKTAAAL